MFNLRTAHYWNVVTMFTSFKPGLMKYKQRKTTAQNYRNAKIVRWILCLFWACFPEGTDWNLNWTGVNSRDVSVSSQNRSLEDRDVLIWEWKVRPKRRGETGCSEHSKKLTTGMQNCVCRFAVHCVWSVNCQPFKDGNWSELRLKVQVVPRSKRFPSRLCKPWCVGK